MGAVSPVGLPVITDEDIRRVTDHLGLPPKAFEGEDGTDPRGGVLKSMESIDVAACPGSGKTTLLVAKLAILADQWQCRTRGICVLSHTNAARREIETRLGNTTAGGRLLAYPHYVGTIHGFVNEFLAIPWLRSLGYRVRIIDTDLCQEWRWNALPYAVRSGLEKNYHRRSILSARSSDFDLGPVHWGRGYLGTTSSTYLAMQEACKRSMQLGYFCYDEMFMWARNAILTMPRIIHVIRDRFPVLFIDEAQDNSEEQATMLQQIFLQGGGAVVRQRFGDGNQAIFDFIGAQEATTDTFPIDTIKCDLPNSQRFGQKIADLAAPLSLAPYALKGQGASHREFLRGGLGEIHTVFLFNEKTMGNVLAAYADLLVEVFTDRGLREGVFTAVGQIHRDVGDAHKPGHVGHYWCDYDPELSLREPQPETFLQYVFAGLGKGKTSGEAYVAVEKIAEGILRLTGMMGDGMYRARRRHSHRYVLALLEEYADVRESYKDIVFAFAVERELLTAEAWNDHWRGAVLDVAKAISGASAPGPEATQFLEWKEARSGPVPTLVAQRSRDDLYRHRVDGKEFAIRVGSVHSMKGETHTATLVLETFWYNYNLESLKEWLMGDKSGGIKEGARIRNRLKIHYVAMTRPSHLLCLAMKRSTFESSSGELDEDLLDKMRRHGWRIREVT